MERSVQISLVLFVILGLGLVYVGNQAYSLEERVDELDYMIIEAGITIDNGDGTTTETVHLTRGATALEGLHRIASVGTKTYSWGTYIVSINGVEENLAANKSWMVYQLENKNDWSELKEGAESYELKNGDNIKFSYETASW